jgi:predicted DNA-binding antitoxin AbrB/MazE fold protein
VFARLAMFGLAQDMIAASSASMYHLQHRPDDNYSLSGKEGRFMMNTVRAYYNGAAFVPMEPCEMAEGTIVKLSVANESLFEAEAARRLAVFERITNNLRDSDAIEPLAPEFDKIMSEKVNFSQGIDL